jgi:hypothetical protein
LILLASPVYAEEKQSQELPKIVQAQLEFQIKKYIGEYVKEFCDIEPGEPGSTCLGSEYKPARRFIYGDLDWDGVDDIAILYAIEGLCCGNYGRSYLSVFLNRGAEYSFAGFAMVGESGERDVEFNVIKSGKILLNTGEYLPDDPMCCPSGKGSTEYMQKDGELIESNRIGVTPIPPIERFRNVYKQTKPIVEEYLKQPADQ